FSIRPKPSTVGLARRAYHISGPCTCAQKGIQAFQGALPAQSCQQSVYSGANTLTTDTKAHGMDVLSCAHTIVFRQTMYETFQRCLGPFGELRLSFQKFPDAL